MLKGISKVIPPELLKVLDEMGHSDRIVLGDSNFPAMTCGKESMVIRCDGIKMPELLEGILELFPLDTFVEHPVLLMEHSANQEVPPIWKTYEKIISKVDPRGGSVMNPIERFRFYEEAKTSYAVVATGEMMLNANIILQKGVITD